MKTTITFVHEGVSEELVGDIRAAMIGKYQSLLVVSYYDVEQCKEDLEMIGDTSDWNEESDTCWLDCIVDDIENLATDVKTGKTWSQLVAEDNFQRTR